MGAVGFNNPEMLKAMPRNRLGVNEMPIVDTLKFTSGAKTQLGGIRNSTQFWENIKGGGFELGSPLINMTLAILC